VFEAYFADLLTDKILTKTLNKLLKILKTKKEK